MNTNESSNVVHYAPFDAGVKLVQEHNKELKRTETSRVPNNSIRSTNPNAKRNKDGDEYIPSKTDKQKKGTARALTRMAIELLVAAGMISGGTAIYNNVKPVEKNFDPAGHSLVEVSDWTGVDIDALLLANSDIEDEEAPLEEKIVVPEEYDYLEGEIKEVKAALEDEDITTEKRKSLKEELAVLEERQEQQKEIGKTYIDEDGKYAYIAVNDAVLAEDLKDAYGIEDGVLRKSNSLSYTWDTLDVDVEHPNYKDYSGAKIYTAVKVPADELNQNFD